MAERLRPPPEGDPTYEKFAAAYDAAFADIKVRRPETPVVYLSDAGATPYGLMERGELRAWLRRVIDELARRGVSPYPSSPQLLGVIEPAVRLLARLRPARSALIRGRRTIPLRRLHAGA